jgi:hypothetical protein
VPGWLYLAMTALVGVVVVLAAVYGVWQFESDLMAGRCSVHTIHGCASWVWDYSEHLRNRPH